MAIFNSYVSLPEGKLGCPPWSDQTTIVDAEKSSCWRPNPPALRTL